jgi:hypothetical protein
VVAIGRQWKALVPGLRHQDGRAAGAQHPTRAVNPAVIIVAVVARPRMGAYGQALANRPGVATLTAPDGPRISVGVMAVAMVGWRIAVVVAARVSA